jgi:uncharacterized membrane protein
VFKSFGDLPLHVLVIHAVVVVLPVAGLVAIVFVLVPKWRWLLRWPTVILGVGSFVLAFVAKQSGLAFLKARPALQQLVLEHEKRGNLLFWYALIFAVITIVAALLLPGPSALASGRGAKTGGMRPLEIVVGAGVVAMSALLVWQTIRTGDAGARAVWTGTLTG